jgi:lincosamide nucleotidyltransferase A/C/D/E
VVSAEDVLEVLDILREAEVRVSIEGGWGVDALLGRQTREHADLDLAVARHECEPAVAALAAVGYRHDSHDRPGLPARLALRAEDCRKVDFHPLLFDADGNGWQQLDRGGWYLHAAMHLWRRGTIAGRHVPCIAPELQLAFRLGYGWSAKDKHDLGLLSAEFGIPLPPTF